MQFSADLDANLIQQRSKRVSGIPAWTSVTGVSLAGQIGSDFDAICGRSRSKLDATALQTHFWDERNKVVACEGGGLPLHERSTLQGAAAAFVATCVVSLLATVGPLFP